MMLEATPATLRLASSNTACRRLTTAERSSVSLVRVRVRSRSSRCAWGGTKLARNSPCCSRSASHSLSATSVLRPGTALTCCALTSSSSQCPSKTWCTGFQYTPVDSMAAWVQPAARSQSRSVVNASVVVPKVRTTLVRRPFATT